MLRLSAAAMLLVGVACSSHVVTDLPAMDGYGPVGGTKGSSGGSSGSGTSGASSGASSGEGSQGPSQPGGGDDAGGTSSGSPGTDEGGSGDVPEAGIQPSNDAGAGGPGDGSSGHPDASPGAGSTALLALCAQRINDARSQAGAAPLAETGDVESYAAKAAASDASSGTRHGYYYATSGGGGIAATEDELDGAQIAPGASAQTTFEQGFQQDLQAQGGAYANLVDTQFSAVGCGFAQDASGNWWVVMALR
jgi:hypothetical protein